MKPFSTRTRSLLKAMMPIFFLLSGCTKTIYIPTKSTDLRIDSDSLTRLVTGFVEQSSSAREKETLYVFRDREVTLNENGDTVRVNTNTITDRSRELESENRLLKSENDSLRRTTSRTDSIYIEKPYPVEKIVEVERKKRWWETALLWTAGFSIFICIIFALMKVKVWR